MQTQFVLFQVANQKGSIRARDGATHVRVLGFFSSKARAQQAAKSFDADVRIAPTCAWNILLNTSEPNQEREQTHYTALMDAYLSDKKKNLDDVMSRADTKSCPELSYSMKKAPLDDSRPIVYETTTCSLPPGQQVCLFAAVPDIFNRWRYNDDVAEVAKKVDTLFQGAQQATGDSSRPLDKAAFYKEHAVAPPELPGDEPLIDFIGVFETEQKSKEFLDTYEDLKEFPRACVSMGTWVRIRDIHTVDVKRYYQDEVLQLFMDGLRTANKRS